MVRSVYDFTEAGPGSAEPLGATGAGLAEMTRLGLPVPPGFTITSDACGTYLATGAPPEGLRREMAAHLAALERTAGRRLGQVDDPLLLSVRAEHPAPESGRTILDIGLNDFSVLGLARPSSRERFAWDSYRRLVQRFGSAVMGVDAALFEDALTRFEGERGAADDTRLDTVDLIRIVDVFKDLIHDRTGEEFPHEPVEQLMRAVLSAFTSGGASTATAVTVQRMVFGNLGADSGSGIAFTHDPATGRPGVRGVYLPNAQGDDLTAGVRDTLPLSEIQRVHPDAYARLCDHLKLLQAHFHDRCDVEFTVERGTLWLLRTRPPATARPPYRTAAIPA